MWVKDAVSDAPRVIFTPGAGDAGQMVKKVIYDPDRPAGEKWLIVGSGVHVVEQTVASFEEAAGL